MSLSKVKEALEFFVDDICDYENRAEIALIELQAYTDRLDSEELAQEVAEIIAGGNYNRRAWYTKREMDNKVEAIFNTINKRSE